MQKAKQLSLMAATQLMPLAALGSASSGSSRAPPIEVEDSLPLSVPRTPTRAASPSVVAEPAEEIPFLSPVGPG
eukprot:2962745-Pyramimonas_sp.AAC.1